MSGYGNGQQLASAMAQNHKAVQQLERDRRHDKEIDRGDAVGVVVKERSPGWRWRTAMLHHVLRHGRLRDIDPELQDLAVDSRRAPQRIG